MKGNHVRPWLRAFLGLIIAGALEASSPPAQAKLLVVVGAPGEAQYASNFTHQVELWRTAAASAQMGAVVIGLEETTGSNDLARLKSALQEEPADDPAPLWMILIGHGTFDGEQARFNLRGPDLSASEFSEWLRRFTRPLAVLNMASSSAPFLTKLSGTNRVVITATRSGHEQYYTRFGGYFAEAVGSLEADLDKDEQVSILEAFLVAARRTAEFYKTEGRVATEHALLDDNADGLGTPADWFVGMRAAKKPKNDSPVDGLLARQLCLVPSSAESTMPIEFRARRDALERAVLLHREQKNELKEEEYFRRLETLLLELARLYEAH